MGGGLAYFVEVARLGSIRRASERLNVAASAISRQVRLYEEEFGTPLLQRTMRGVSLTAAGEVFLVYAKAVASERDRARQGIDALNGLTRGHVRLASIDGVIAGPLSDVIARFRSQHPGVTFELRSMGSEAVVDAVRRGDADIGVAFFSNPGEGVRIAHRVVDPVFALVAAGHGMARRKRLTLSEALCHPLALPDTTFGVRRLIDAICLGQKLRPSIVLETNSIEALRGFARSGAGLAMLPYLTSRRDVELGTVVALPLDDPGFQTSSVDVVVHSDRSVSVASSAFLAMVRETMGVNSAPGARLGHGRAGRNFD